MPVVGSASIPMSGTPRPPVGFCFTMPSWYHGCAKISLKPPPAPYWKGTVFTQVEPDRLHFEVPQPVSNSRVAALPIPSEVPPTAVTHGSPAGKSGCGITPGGLLVAVVAGREVEADALQRALLEDRLVGVDEALVDRDVEHAVDHHEGRLAPRVRDDRGLVVGHDLRQLREEVVVVAAAARRSSRTFAPGAIPCTASTSSVCSPYQPLPPQSATRA